MKLSGNAFDREILKVAKNLEKKLTYRVGQKNVPKFQFITTGDGVMKEF